MTPPSAGAALGAAAALGGLTMVSALTGLGRSSLAARLDPYLRDLHSASSPTALPASRGHRGLVRQLAEPWVRRLAGQLERLLGGAASVQRRLHRAGRESTVEDFRINQVVWGAAGLAGALALSLLVAARGDLSGTVPVVLCAAGMVGGVFLCEQRLNADVRSRERRMLVEFPTVAELLALAVAAGEGPVSALDRVVRTCRGELTRELGHVLAEIRIGVPVTTALRRLSERAALPPLARFAEGVAVAIERGTPLADVLRAQATDVRDAGRRAVIETGARKEVAMLVPVVFLILPVTVVFAFYPGVAGLDLVTP